MDLKTIRKQYSVVGMAIFVFAAASAAAQFLMAFLLGSMGSNILETTWGLWILTFVPIYCIAFPLTVLTMRAAPACPPEKHSLGFSRGIKVFFICAFLMYGGNILGTLITNLLSQAAGTNDVNPLSYYIDNPNMLLQVLVFVILAPIVEELIFRKMLIDRIRIYGSKTAVVLSGLLFGLFHGNLSQFFYAFGMGIVFAYLYVNTGKLRYSILAHVIINFIGGIFSVQLLNHATAETVPGIWTLALTSYSLALLGSAAAGLVILLCSLRKLHVPPALVEIPAGKHFFLTFCNIGVILAVLSCLGMFALTLLS